MINELLDDMDGEYHWVDYGNSNLGDFIIELETIKDYIKDN